jgi:threonine dehydrogenase-like Zn-dependent dehydrogenase
MRVAVLTDLGEFERRERDRPDPADLSYRFPEDVSTREGALCEPLSEAVAVHTEGRGVDVAIEASGAEPAIEFDAPLADVHDAFERAADPGTVKGVIRP